MPDIVKHTIKTTVYLSVCMIVFSCGKDNTKDNSNVPGAGGSLQLKKKNTE